MDSEKAPKMKTLYWTMKLLEYFDEEHERRGVTELAELTRIPKSSVSNALNTFEQLGYVRRHTLSGQYSLGPKAVCLYHNYFVGNRDAALYRRECRILSDRTNSIVQVCFFMDGKLICLTGAMPARYGRDDVSGREIPLHATAAGKAILAFMEEQQREGIYRKGLRAVTRHTITDPVRLEEELEAVRRREYATETMENEYGITAIAINWVASEQRT